MIDNAQIKTFFNEKSYVWDDSAKDASRKCQQIFEIPQLKDAFAGASVLDVGCGTGVAIPHIVAAGASQILGIDLSKKMIEVAKKKFACLKPTKLDSHNANADKNSEKKHAAIKFQVADIFNLQENGTFDVVMMYNVYPHLAHKDNLVKHVIQLLKQNGRFVIAHGSSKDTIDKIHASHTCDISEPILPARKEAKRWKEFFEVDTLIDSQQMYCISGKLRS